MCLCARVCACVHCVVGFHQSETVAHSSFCSTSSNERSWDRTVLYYHHSSRALMLVLYSIFILVLYPGVYNYSKNNNVVTKHGIICRTPATHYQAVRIITASRDAKTQYSNHYYYYYNNNSTMTVLLQYTLLLLIVILLLIFIDIHYRESSTLPS